MSFISERWLTGATAAHHPRPANIPSGNPKFLVLLSCGSRNCIGQTLANVEIYLTLALFLRTFARLEKNGRGEIVVKGIQLWETDRRDVDIKRDDGLDARERTWGT
jgi:cytochrome P450